MTTRKQYEWWCQLERRCQPDRPLDGESALYNLEGDISRSLRSAIENAGQPRRGRHAIRTLGYMMGRRYMPGIGALIGNVPEDIRHTVEFECAEFQRGFLRKLDAVFKWRVIDRDTVLILVREFFEHWQSLADFAQEMTSHSYHAAVMRRYIGLVNDELLEAEPPVRETPRGSV